ncbi:Cyclin-dependent kinase F-4 [Melia azedarach]|uniref:Cyclin-dependent kinase F-4 n=1 Tax=Melia azedarach TaxID=155640 RepID=A0ACC1YLK4_MELAZ|nr:Cyclin-dependent kinase F-4 [Melia azedarach]
MPSASENAISLIRSLCSWNPCKRPTAAEALQHPSFHSFFYVPRPLHSRAAVDATTQYAINLMLLQQGARMYFGDVPDLMQVGNFPPPGLSTGVQHISAQQGTYYPAPGRNADGVSDTAGDFANTTNASHRQYVAQQELPPMMLQH